MVNRKIRDRATKKTKKEVSGRCCVKSLCSCLKRRKTLAHFITLSRASLENMTVSSLSSFHTMGGGGSGGAVLRTSYSLNQNGTNDGAGIYDIHVGDGGTPGTRGKNSSIFYNSPVPVAPNPDSPDTEVFASGGEKTVVGEYPIHTFKQNGTFGIGSLPADAKFDVLVVGGGGGAGRSPNESLIGGGGGSGGVKHQRDIIFPSTGQYNITIGDGGIYKQRGSNSSISALINPEAGSSIKITLGFLIIKQEISNLRRSNAPKLAAGVSQ